MADTWTRYAGFPAPKTLAPPVGNRPSTMEPSTHELLETMRGLICADTGDLDARDGADRAFRRLYLSMMEQSDTVPFAVREQVREALLALVGDDDWPTACALLQGALRSLTAETR